MVATLVAPSAALGDLDALIAELRVVGIGSPAVAANTAGAAAAIYVMLAGDGALGDMQTCRSVQDLCVAGGKLAPEHKWQVQAALILLRALKWVRSRD